MADHNDPKKKRRMHSKIVPSLSMNNEVVRFSASESAKFSQRKSASAKAILKIIDHWSFTTFMTLLTIYALFGDDLRLLVTTKSADNAFYSASVLCLVSFIVEIVLGSIVKDGYFLSFFFWLDIVATVSLIPDIGWIWEPFLDLVSGSSSSSSSDDATDASQIARAGRASRAGTRAGRIIRILRVIRLIRIVKLYKLSQEAKGQGGSNKDIKRGMVNYRGENQFALNALEQSIELEDYSFDDASGSHSFVEHESVVKDAMVEITTEQKVAGDKKESEPLNFDLPEESNVGKKLSELTTRRVIMLVLGMMFGLPLFYTTLYLDTNTSFQFGLEVLNLYVEDDVNFNLTWTNYVREHKDLDTPLIYLEIKNKDTYEGDVDREKLRDTEQEQVTLEDVEEDYDYASLAVFDLRFNTKLEAGLSMIRTVFVCIVLAISSIFFSNDAQNLILGPIETMITKVKNIAKNPLKAVQEEEREEYTKQLVLQDTAPKKQVNEMMETQVLELTITKIAALLALGFGEAGSEIIAANMQRGGGDVDPMIAGKRIHCIFGFCDIRNFTDATEVLQQEVMRFVNEIAEVVHGVVDSFSGKANKNIGDAFLLVWKFPDDCLEQGPEGLVLTRSRTVNAIADMAIVSFVKIISEINVNPSIVKYRQHPGLARQIVGYSVKMGFGLHQGWAIEGAIGSEYKIDASYLSPNVNMASRLEAATKQFGVPLLLSDSIQRICSPETRNYLRMIDRVTVKGSLKPIELYTCDLDVDAVEPKGTEYIKKAKGDPKRNRIMLRIKRDSYKKKVFSGELSVASQFTEDPDLVKMREGLSKEFLKEFELGLREYLKGNWNAALLNFECAEALKGESDGPTRTLVKFIQDEGGSAPSDWLGYRELNEK